MGSWSWIAPGLGAVAGSLAGAYVGTQLGSRSGHGGRDSVWGLGLGAFIGGALGSAIAGNTTASASGGTTVIVPPPAIPPGPAAPPALPPTPPAPAAPPSPYQQGTDQVLTDAQSIYAAESYLGQWWQALYTRNPSAVNGQLYTPVLTGTDPNFVNALAYFQQYANLNYGATIATLPGIGVPSGQLPYTDGTLDTYTLLLLQYVYNKG